MKIMPILTVALLAVSAMAQTNTTNTATNAHPRKSLAEITGGFIFKPIDENSRGVLLLDGRSDKSDSTIFDKFEKRLERQVSIYTKRAAGDVATYKNAKEDLVLALVDQGGTLCVYPERKMAVVPLREKDAFTIDSLWRGFSALLSSDGLNDMLLLSLLDHRAKQLNIPVRIRTTYRAAVKEGWAPAPTNDFQKAIWEKIKAEKEAAAKPAEATEAK